MTKPCATCAHVIRATPKLTLCALNRENAHAERANPNGCGPEGKNWEAALAAA